MKYQPPYGMESTPDAPYVNGDPTIGRQGSIPPAASIEYPQREIVNLITASAIIPDDADLKQLTKSVRDQRVNFCVDTGLANALQVLLDPPLNNYKQGLPLRVLVAHNNTGASTINVNSLGNRPIKRANGAALEVGDLIAGQIAELVDDGTQFQMINYLGKGGTSSVINNYTTDVPYSQDTGTPNNIVCNLTTITSFTPGQLCLVRVAYKNTTNVVIRINATTGGPYNLLRNDGQYLQSDDLIANETLLLEWNAGGYWQMMRLCRSQVFFKLTADLILYVRTDGNDANDGSANTAASAFRTIQAAINFVKRSFLIAGRTVTIQLGVPGTYTGQVNISDVPGTIVVRGDPANMLGYLIQAIPSYTCVATGGSGTNVSLVGMSFALATSDTDHIAIYAGSSCSIRNCAFTGIYAVVNVAVFQNAVGICAGELHNYTNSGTCVAVYGGSFTMPVGEYSTWNTHGVNFSNAFAVAFLQGAAQFPYPWVTFTGGASGVRYGAAQISMISTGAGTEFLPGNMPGSVQAGSYYD